MDFPRVLRGNSVLNPQLPARLLKNLIVGVPEVFEHLFPLVEAHQQIALVGFVLSMFLHVLFITLDLDSQGNNSSLQGGFVFRVGHDLVHKLLFLDFQHFFLAGHFQR